MRSKKEVREFQLEMLRVQLRHEERMTWFSTLITSVIALTIFFLSLVGLGLQLSSQLAISGGTELTELTALIINFLIFYGGLGSFNNGYSLFHNNNRLFSAFKEKR